MSQRRTRKNRSAVSLNNTGLDAARLLLIFNHYGLPKPMLLQPIRCI